jgi:NADH dehydrogenase FAD-containing subunit
VVEVSFRAFQAWIRDGHLTELRVCAGPTGVEFAAELYDFLVEDLTHIFPSIKDEVQVSIIQSQDHILNTYDQKISQFAEEQYVQRPFTIIEKAAT